MSRVFRVSALVSLSTVLALILVHCSTGKAIPKLESPEWFLLGNSGHFTGQPSPSSATLATITDSIIPLLGGYEGRSYYTENFVGTWVIDSSQTWIGRTVYNMFFNVRRQGLENPIDSFTYPACMAIALSTKPGLARLIYISWTYAGGIYFEHSKQTVERKDTILYTKSRVSGSGGYYEEAYWVWDRAEGVPRELDFRRDYFVGNRQVFPPHHSNHSLLKAIDTHLTVTPNWTYFDSHELRFEAAPTAGSLDSLVGVFVRDKVSGMFYGDYTKAYLTWLTDTIGTLHGYAICRSKYDVHESHGGLTGGKVISIQLGQDLFRLVYLGIFYQPDSELARDGVMAISGDSIICTKGWLNGSNRYRDNYWLWPSTNEVPVSLYQEWVLIETLAQIAKSQLPAGLTIRQHKGIWDFRKLTYDTYTWRKQDKDEQPTGGKLHVQFGIRDQRLAPIDFTFDAGDTLTRKR